LGHRLGASESKTRIHENAMPKVIVKNEKGLIAKLYPKALISARGLARLNASMARFDKERPDLAPAARA